MKTSSWRVLVSVILLSACAADDGDLEDPTIGNAELGVVRFETGETASDLRIRGLGVNEQVVVDYQLHVGVVPVDYLEETTLARVIDVNVRGTVAPRWTSGGVEPITPPLPQGDLGLFLSDPYVSEVLARWGIVYSEFPMPALEEVAYSCTGCSMGCGVRSCADQGLPGGTSYRIYVCANNPGTGWNAVCGYTPGTGTPCGTAGPNGCGSCPSYYLADGCDAACSGGYPYWSYYGQSPANSQTYCP